MIWFNPDHLKTKKMCKRAFKPLPFVIRCVPAQYIVPQMCDKAVVENDGTLKFVTDNYKIKKCVIKLLMITETH